jgi:putative spermidine/putrescine transport system substrate-binding protein
MPHAPRRTIFATALLCCSLLLAACAAPVTPTAATAAGVTPGGSTPAGAPTYSSWDEVVAAAEGTTVNWFVWGGSDVINTNIDNDIGEPLAAQFGVTLNRVPVEATSDAVNKVLSEKAAGKNSGGSIDLIWINGQNFRTLKDAGLLYGPFTELLPNNQFVDWENPAVANDFGVPVDGYESPWAAFQFVYEYNTAAVGDTPPRTFEELAAWAAANPGRFTYPAPPNHVGSAFVRQLFYWAAGDTAPFLGPFDQAVYERVAPEVWAYLNVLEPNLWRSGQTYPEVAAMADLLANGEIDFAMEYDANRASNFIAEGRYPETIRTFVLDSGTVANISYVAIPYNATNPAGAMVLANFLLSPKYQLHMAAPAPWGWMMAIDPARLPAELQPAGTGERGAATLPPDVLVGAALPEMAADWVSAIDAGWVANVLEK